MHAVEQAQVHDVHAQLGVHDLVQGLSDVIQFGLGCFSGHGDAPQAPVAAVSKRS
ncbi:hypothetical protein ACFFX0_04090 [Citricoccus parietis]|uniref:Uncharacterized protein n=1 Tax=Citricoccus parietis TaxID=592307 RepID=A0ABV5FUQ2_9MICC